MLGRFYLGEPELGRVSDRAARNTFLYLDRACSEKKASNSEAGTEKLL